MLRQVSLGLLLAMLFKYQLVVSHPQLKVPLPKLTGKSPTPTSSTFVVNPRTVGPAPPSKPVTVPQSKYDTIYTAVKGSPKLPPVPAHAPVVPPRVESLLPYNQRVQFSLFPGEAGFKVPKPNILSK
uniref:Hypothetical secreted peptide n=1 Tax=Simulium guianense TaxID=445764 RepID=F5GTW2_SIMGU